MPSLRARLVKEKDVQFQLKFKPSQFTERLIWIDGHPFNHDGGFKSRPYLHQMYDVNHKRLLLKCARQVEKSTTLGNRILTMSILNPHFRTMYITPTELQARKFERERLNKPLTTSPGLKNFADGMLLNNIMFKEFYNHASITLGSVFHSPDRVRGTPADFIQLDEFQDIISDHIPVIEESLSHSKKEYRYFWGAGTPKTMDNPLEIYWDRFSTQTEWTVPCERHSSIHWNILGIKSIGKDGIVCDICHLPIFAAAGKWQITGDPDAQFHGYRIPQLMVPWLEWANIQDRLKRYPTDKFYNEVLGVSYDSGTRPLTRGDLESCCTPGLQMDEASLRRLISQHRIPLFMGIDYGTGDVSYTVVTIIGYHPQIGKPTVLYMKRFVGEEAEPVKQLDIIQSMIGNFRIHLTGTDYGFGFYQNDALVRAFGQRKIATYMYSSAQHKKVRWDNDLKRFMVNRTAVMADIFNAIKRKQFAFPDKNVFMTEFGADFLNIFAEYSERSRMILYNHPPDRPDDAFHSFLFSFLASMIEIRRPEIMNPDAETTS
jgi:hypothetical protein